METRGKDASHFPIQQKGCKEAKATASNLFLNRYGKTSGLGLNLGISLLRKASSSDALGLTTSNHRLFGSSISMICKRLFAWLKMTQPITLLSHMFASCRRQGTSLEHSISMTEAVDQHPSRTTGHSRHAHSQWLSTVWKKKKDWSSLQGGRTVPETFRHCPSVLHTQYLTYKPAIMK